MITDGELEALHVLAWGPAARGVRTEADAPRGVRSVHSKTARQLIDKGLARAIPGWRAVEITDAGAVELERLASHGRRARHDR